VREKDLINFDTLQLAAGRFIQKRIDFAAFFVKKKFKNYILLKRIPPQACPAL